MPDVQELAAVERAELPARAAGMARDGYRLVMISFLARPDGFELTYSFDRDYRLVSLRTFVPAGDPVVPSITPAYFCAFTYENEIQDLCGIKVTGLPLDFMGNFYRKAAPAPFSRRNGAGGAG
jgi:ech hydrogenase subunit D